MNKTGQVIYLPRTAAILIDAIGKLGYTGEPVEESDLSEELQEQMLWVLDEVYGGEVYRWLFAIVQIVLANPMKAQTTLQIWADAFIDRYATEETLQFA